MAREGQECSVNKTIKHIMAVLQESIFAKNMENHYQEKIQEQMGLTETQGQVR